jgi:hypothetical protein
MADQAEGALHPHRQSDAVHLEAQFASFEAGGGFQMARGLWGGQGRHRQRVQTSADKHRSYDGRAGSGGSGPAPA